MNNRGIRLHKEHGLNPTIAKCIICGKDKQEIALLGASYNGEAPRSMVIDIEPCPECRKKYLEEAGGILLIEADEYDQQPTGALVVLKEEAFKRIITSAIPPKRIAFIAPEVYNLIIELQEKGEINDNTN